MRILWAVDPIDFDRASMLEVEQMLKTSDSAFEVHPVYVLSPGELRIDEKLFTSSNAAFKKGAEIKLQALLSPLIKDRLIIRPKVISSSGRSLEESVDTLLAYSKRIKSDFILLGVNRKISSEELKGFGSFSRVLLARSETASIAIGLKDLYPTADVKVLFATDLSHASLMDLIKFSYLSKKLGSELSFIQKGDYLGASASKLRIDRFSKLAKKCGVKATYVELDSKNPSANELVSFAAKNQYTFMGLSCSVLNSI